MVFNKIDLLSVIFEMCGGDLKDWCLADVDELILTLSQENKEIHFKENENSEIKITIKNFSD